MIEKGFYYHHKHDPVVLTDHAYEVLGVGRHTEDESYVVVYRPLYETPFLGEAGCFVRPLAMFAEEVTKDDKTFPRFTRITEPTLIAQLEKIRGEMYD
jgi:hypothetical protein